MWRQSHIALTANRRCPISNDEPCSWSYGLYIPHDPRAVTVTRATLRAILRADRLNCLADAAELLVSELVTNAYRNSSADMYVAVDRTPSDVEVAVYDTGPGSPRQRRPQTMADNGRGLALVSSYADAWGVREFPESGKAVWFKMAPKPG